MVTKLQRKRRKMSPKSCCFTCLHIKGNGRKNGTQISLIRHRCFIKLRLHIPNNNVSAKKNHLEKISENSELL